MGKPSQELGHSRFGAAIGGAWKLVKLGMDDRAASLEADVHSLSEPHLAVLVHKREKHFESLELAGERRWYAELHAFVLRVLKPRLDVNPVFDGVSVDDLADMVDDMVAAVHRRDPAASDVPMTSRFDSGWAV